MVITLFPNRRKGDLALTQGPAREVSQEPRLKFEHVLAIPFLPLFLKNTLGRGIGELTMVR